MRCRADLLVFVFVSWAPEHREGASACPSPTPRPGRLPLQARLDRGLPLDWRIRHHVAFAAARLGRLRGGMLGTRELDWLVTCRL